MKFVLTKEEVISINHKLGGALRSDSSLEFAFSAAEGKSDRGKLALLWRAVLIDHPFDDANKRTIEVITRIYAKAKGYKIDTKRLVKEIIEVSKENVQDLKTIERRIKYGLTGN